MSKIKLGAAPKNFKKIVEIPLNDGTVAEITMSFIYRTRTQFGALLDEIINESKKATTEIPIKSKVVVVEKMDGSKKNVPLETTNLDEDIAKTLTSIYAEGNAAQVAALLKIADGWDLDDEFNESSLLQLVDEYPNANIAISDAYRVAITEGPIKN